MQPVSLADSGLGIEAAEITQLFEPFVDRRRSEQPGAWQAEVARRKRKLAKRAAQRLVAPWRPATQRRESTVLAEYDHAWRSNDYRGYSLDSPQRDYTPWQWREQRMFASDVGATRFRQLLLIRFVELVRPRRLLEVGCGNGINLLLLAGRFPDLELTGIELTAAGHEAALRFQDQPELPVAMQAFAPQPLLDPSAFRRVRFEQGNAAELPFADGAFDLVITILALEQMERLRDAALREIARVTASSTLMIEPFADVNTALWPRLNVLRRNYFRGRIDDLAGYGLTPRLALDDYPQESFLRTCAVLADKAGAGTAPS